MPITAEQRKARRAWIGASDVPAIMGIDPFGRTAYDVWAEKTNKVPDTDEATEAQEAGTFMEVAVLDWYQKTHADGDMLLRNQFRNLPALHLGSNLDGLRIQADGKERPVEGKTTGLFGPTNEPWGEYGTDQVPDRIIAQTHAQMMCCNAERDDVPVFIGGRGFGLFVVTITADLVELIASACVGFWQHVERDIPPDVMPSIDTAKVIRRQPGKTISIPADVVRSWDDLRTARLAAEKAEEAAKRVLLSALGDAEVGDFGSPTHVISYAKGTTHYKAREACDVQSRTLRTVKRSSLRVG